MSKEEVGLIIRKIRINMGMTKEQFAKALSISSQYLGMIERGKGSLSIDKLYSLCTLSNVSADFILFGNECTVIETTKEALSTYSADQIASGCDCLNKLALFIRSLN